MELYLHRPTPPLDTFVELLTYYRGFDPDHSRERLLPDGAVEIIVDLTETPKRLYHPESFAEFRSFHGAWISGMRRKWLIIEAAPASSMLVIRFRPGGAYPFLGFDVDAVTDVVEPLDGVLGRGAGSLRDRILAAPTAADKLQAAESWLSERARGRLESNPAVSHLADRLFAPAGLRLSDAVAELGYSQRHVRNLCRRWLGLTPKQYAVVRRFNGLVRHVAGAPPESFSYPNDNSPLDHPDWADLALHHGYFDQSHLIHEFRSCSGITPTEYVGAYRGLENYLPLD